MELLFLFILILAVVLLIFVLFGSEKNRKRERHNSIVDNFLLDTFMRRIRSRHGYYNDIYLKSKAWQRKRYVVLRRDNWVCVYCGAPATQVHHKQYARKNIGREPIDWLVSVCRICHEALH
jgi:hypothetical protein